MDFELRWRGVVRKPGTSWERQLKALRDIGLLRGPIALSLVYELTTAGCDAAAKFCYRDLAPNGHGYAGIESKAHDETFDYVLRLHEELTTKSVLLNHSIAKLFRTCDDAATRLAEWRARDS